MTDEDRQGRVNSVAEKHLTIDELEAGLDEIRQSPRDRGVLRLIVRRPKANAREVLEEGHLDPARGLVGDTWETRGSSGAGADPLIRTRSSTS